MTWQRHAYATITWTANVHSLKQNASTLMKTHQECLYALIGKIDNIYLVTASFIVYVSTARNGIAGSCKKYDGWCNLLHPAPTKKATNKEVPGDGEDLFPALSSEVTEAAENGPPGTPKPSAAATTSYADTVKREAPPQPPNSPPMRAAPPSPASSHAVSSPICNTLLGYWFITLMMMMTIDPSINDNLWWDQTQNPAMQILQKRHMQVFYRRTMPFCSWGYGFRGCMSSL